MTQRIALDFALMMSMARIDNGVADKNRTGTAGGSRTTTIKKEHRVKKLIFLVGLMATMLTGCNSMYGYDDPGMPSQWPWETVSPESQGIQSADIDRMVEHVESNNLDVHSVIIYRDGTIPVEIYFDPFDATTTHNMKSTSKGIISTLVGIALHEGFIESLDESVLSYMPEYYDGDPGKRDITIRDLLTMSAGLKWDENDLNSMYTFFVSKRIAKRVLAQPLEQTPGTTFNYNTGLTHLLSVVISRASGMSTMEFAQQYLFGPLEIDNVQWDTDRDGVHIGGSELFLTPRDMMKLGVVYLNGGVYDGLQVVPAQWVRNATSTQITGSFHGASVDYGYLWWLGISNSLFAYLDDDGAFLAMGVRGQRVLVLPKSNTVVLVTADQHDESQVDRLIRDYIWPVL